MSDLHLLRLDLAFVTVLALVALAGILALSDADSSLVSNVITAIVSIISLLYIYRSSPTQSPPTTRP